jgi:hypothetical protein
MQLKIIKMTAYRYILEKGSTKHHCPNCEQKTLVKYVDTETGDYLPDQYGRCDREVNCTYHLNPYIEGYIKMIGEQERGNHSEKLNPDRSAPRPKPALNSDPAFIPSEVLKRTLQGYEHNVFIQNLLNQGSFPFEVEDVEKAISMYYLGTVNKGYMAGGITFPFIDINGNIRTIQVKHFDQDNHTTGTDFIHSIVEKKYKERGQDLPQWLHDYKENDKKVSCLFGEHLLGKHTINPIALVEAPKTAIYGALYFGPPENSKSMIWLAVYNLSSLNLIKCRVLKGRDVYLFPDLSKDGGAFDLWSKRAKEFELKLPGTRFIVSDFLEHHASEFERNKGCDLADYLIQLDWHDFRPSARKGFEQSSNYADSAISQVSQKGSFQKVINSSIQSKKSFEGTNNWPIVELEHYFKSATISNESIRLNRHTIIIDPKKFINSHLEIVKAQNGKAIYRPYNEWLVQLKSLLTLSNN